MRIRLRLIVGAVLAAAVTTAGWTRMAAHKGITSKYTYNEHVFPIVHGRCGRCHVEGGVAPMSLMTYKDARPWAEAIRLELMAGHMPPWSAEEGPLPLRTAHGLTAFELDVLMTWASGGTPEGDRAPAASTVSSDRRWALGPPDLELALPSSTIPADRMEARAAFTVRLPPGVSRLRAVDFQPGNPAIVRGAEVTLAGTEPPRVLTLWLPGEDPVPLPTGSAFVLPAGSELRVSLRYQKTWRYEGQAMTDQSTIGLYFADRTARRDMHAVTLTAHAGGESAVTLDTTADIVALRADADRADLEVAIAAHLPDGTRAIVARLQTAPEWPRRYWLVEPFHLPRGARLVAAVPSASGAPPQEVRVTLDVVSAAR
jgi:hypothetical protein